MARLNCEKVLEQLISEVETMRDWAKHVKTETSDSILTQPKKGAWSVVQCFSHLNHASDHYLPAVKDTIQAAMSTAQNKEVEYKEGWIGSLAVKRMKPRSDGSIPGPMRTFKKLDPERLPANNEDVINRFIADQEEYLNCLKNCRLVSLESNSVPTLFPLLKLRLGDIFRFVIAHQERHILQANRTLELIKNGIG